MKNLRGLFLPGLITFSIASLAVGATNAPNIMFIFTDDHSYRMVSCYPRSYEFAHTPNIDALAERGVRFDQAYMGAKCRPSRAMVLAGRQQFAVETDYDGNEIPGSIHWFPTIRSNGYYTGMIGKWHYYGDDDTQHGTSWDWSVIWRHAASDAVGDNYYWDQYVSIDGGTQEPLNGYSTDRYADFTEQFIQERAEDPDQKPWFYWLAFGGVHAPYTPAARHKSTLDSEPEPPIPVDIYGPRFGKTEYYQDSKWTDNNGTPYLSGQSLEFWTKQQMEAVLAIDDAVGRIVQKLEDTGQLDNTIIVFTADQGYVWGQHGLKGKIDPYETAIRSPFIVSNPARFPTNKVCKAPINGPDLMRTFHAWADAEPQQFMPGRDITPLIENPDSEPVLDEWSQVPTLMSYVEYTYEPNEIATRLANEDWSALMHGSDEGYAPYYFMILVENYKYTRYAIPDQIEELYDLDNDPEELDNLAIKPQFKSKVLEMRAACIQSIKDNGGVVFADLLPEPSTAAWWPLLDSSDNAHVLYNSGVAQDDTQVLKTKNGWGSSDSRLAYLRFNLSGVNEIGNHPADSLLSVSLDLWMTQTEGDTSNDLQVFALVDDAQDLPSDLSESTWTGMNGANPLLGTNLPQGNSDPGGSALTTALLGSYTFAADGDNSELGLVQIPLTVSDFKTLLGNDSNGEITLIVRSTSTGDTVEFASMNTTNSQWSIPTLTIDALPDAPDALAATTAPDGITLNWQDNTEMDLSGYNVYRSTNSGIYGSAIATNLAASDYMDREVVNGTTYYYAVTAVDAYGNESPKSTEVTVTLDTNLIPPAAPAGFGATAGDGRVALYWDENTETDMGTYSVYRSTTQGSNRSLVRAGLTSTAYIDETAENGMTYYYVVTAVDMDNLESLPSDEVSASPAAVLPPPGLIVFGSDNEGWGGFTQSDGTAAATWTMLSGSVQNRNQDNGFENTSLLREVVLDRTPGSSYTMEGVVHLTDGYAADNNRVGIYLFGDASKVGLDEQDGDLEAGALSLQINLDGSNVRILEGLNGSTTWATETKIGAVGSALFGTDLTFTANIVFTNATELFVEFSLTDSDGVITTVSGTFPASSYAGDWFGFATRTRARNYPDLSDPKGTPSVMDYKSFRVTDNNAPVSGYDTWAEGHGGTNVIGTATNDADFDGLSNLYEYGIGGDPTNRLVYGEIPTLSKSGDRFLYIHPQRADDDSLIYTVQTTDDLVSGTWTNLGYTITGTNITDGTLNFVTNDVDTVRNKNFIRLKIEQ